MSHVATHFAPVPGRLRPGPSNDGPSLISIGALAGVPARQQQRTGRAFAEPGREQRRPADLGGHQRGHLVGVEHEKVCAGRILVGVG